MPTSRELMPRASPMFGRAATGRMDLSNSLAALAARIAEREAAQRWWLSERASNLIGAAPLIGESLTPSRVLALSDGRGLIEREAQ